MAKTSTLLHLLHSRIVGVVLLLAVGGICIALQPRVPGFGPRGHHNQVSAHGAVLARNMSLSRLGFTYHRAELDSDGQIRVEPYNRFPPTAFLLMKAGMHMAGDDFTAQLLVARGIMLAFYLAAMLCAFLLVYELTGSNALSLFVAFAAFSNAYVNYYHDMLFNDTPALFGCLLAAQGMAVAHVRQKRPQLFVKTAVAVLLGWQALAVVLVYAVVSPVGALISTRSAKRFFASHALWLGALAGLLAAAVLALNLWNEQRVMQLPFRELPTVQSLTVRTGQNAEANEMYAKYLRWSFVLPQQAYRVGKMCYPLPSEPVTGDPLRHRFEIYGVAVLVAILAGAVVSKHRVILLVLALSGFVWSIPMKAFTVFHDFQTIFYIGTPLALGLLIGLCMQKFLRPGLPIAALAAACALAASHRHLAGVKTAHFGDAATITRDFQSIMQEAGTGRTMCIHDGLYNLLIGHARDFYLADGTMTADAGAEFIISADPSFAPKTLTPRNRILFLFPGPGTVKTPRR